MARTEVVVIGAGVAGLAAARTLQELDYDVLILEARERLGGRVWSRPAWHDLTLDLGASWIHGDRGNPLTALTRQYGIKSVVSDYDSITVYDSAGRAIKDGALERLEARFETLLETLEALRERMDERDADDISLQAGFEKALAQDKVLDERERQALHYVLASQIEHEYGADAAEMSLYYWDEGEEFGGHHRLFPAGYGQLVEALAEGLDIRLRHAVQRVSYDKRGVTVETTQGPFKAQCALVTLPLGVLKRGSVHFDPPLPARKQKAIERIGMGLLNKVYLRFPHVFWDESEWIGHIAHGQGTVAEFVNMDYYLGQPILLGFIAGSKARQLEGRPDKEIVAEMMAVLQRCYGQAIPAPTDWLITRWGTDPFAGGAYSFLATHAKEGDRQALAEPVQGRLFFAGEATSMAYPATVHGALLSGEQAARHLDDTWE